MSTPPPGRRAAPRPTRLSGLKPTRGRRVAGDPPTGEIPVVAPETVEPGRGRRIRAAAPVSTAADTGTFPVIRAEVPADVPEPTPEPQPDPTPEPAPFPVAPSPVPPPAPQPDTVFPEAPAPVPASPPTSHVPLPAPVPVDPTSAGVQATKLLKEEKKAAAAARRREERRSAARSRLGFWAVVLGLGVVALAAAALHVGPDWLAGAGAVLVLTTYSWAAAARTGGRQVVFSVLAFAIGISALLVDGSVLRSGAAVMTCVVSGVLAVVLTVPARSFPIAVREVVIATAIASVGAFATVGFEPVASTVRFNYLTLAIGFGALVLLVWRFAAGLHGLGTRGLAIIAVGTLLLAVSLAYTEALRHFGVTGVTQPLADFTAWCRDTLGAAPRLLTVLLGVPALVWGVHMRARRRQGWWVCTFGFAATLPVAQRLVNLDISYVEAGLQTFYSVALGIFVGWLLIRLDLQMTGTRGARARAAEELDAVRPEPRRFSSL